MVLLGYRVGPLLKKTYREVLADNVLGLSAQTAYYFFFSLFPLLLFLAPLLSLIGNKQETFDQLTRQLQSAMPSEGWGVISKVVEDVVFAENAPGLVSAGALLAIWAGSNVFSALIDALNRAYDAEETRPWWRRKLVAVGSVLVIGLVILSSTVLIIGGEHIVNRIADSLALGEGARATLLIVQIPVGFLLLVAIAALSYYFLPNVRQSKRHVLVGSLVTTALWVLMTLAFRAYVTSFGNYNKTYGAIGGVIVLLTWMYLSSLIFLVGGELNAELQHGTGAVRPRRGALYGGRIETAAAAGVTSLERIERVEPLGARHA